MTKRKTTFLFQNLSFNWPSNQLGKRWLSDWSRRKELSRHMDKWNMMHTAVSHIINTCVITRGIFHIVRDSLNRRALGPANAWALWCGSWGGSWIGFWDESIISPSTVRAQRRLRLRSATTEMIHHWIPREGTWLRSCVADRVATESPLFEDSTVRSFRTSWFPHHLLESTDVTWTKRLQVPKAAVSSYEERHCRICKNQEIHDEEEGRCELVPEISEARPD